MSIMKKYIIYFICLFFLILGGAFLSYSKALKSAKNISQYDSEQISPLKGNLILFINDEFSPCWIFRGEYKYLMTGATFDVHVSLFGHVFKEPPKRPKERRAVKKQ